MSSAAIVLSVLKAFGNVARDDPLGKAFDNRRLYQRPARRSAPGYSWCVARLRTLHDAPNFGVAADDRIHLSLACELNQIAAVLFEGLILVFGALVGNALTAANALECLEDLLVPVIPSAPASTPVGLALDLGEG